MLIKKLQLDVRGNPRSMSKGMKQKLAIVLALMNDPQILFFDEPTTGLDPLMRESFMEIVKEQKNKGKTILMSSHIYEELEEFSDKVGLIVNGKLLDIADISEIENVGWRLYKVEFADEEQYFDFIQKNDFEITRKQDQYSQVTVKVPKENLQKFFEDISKYDIKFFRGVEYNLESYFNEELRNN